MLVYLSVVDKHKEDPARPGHAVNIGAIIIDVPQIQTEDTHYDIHATNAPLETETDLRHYVGILMTKEQVELMDAAIKHTTPARFVAWIKAEPVIAKDLKPGELFSVRGPEYWDTFSTRDSVGESAYIRTNVPGEKFPDADAEVFRITIVREVIR